MRAGGMSGEKESMQFPAVFQCTPMAVSPCDDCV